MGGVVGGLDFGFKWMVVCFVYVCGEFGGGWECLVWVVCGV